MFSSLTEKLELTFKRLKNKAKLSKEEREVAIQEIRTALLEADVSYEVVESFCENLKTRLSDEVFSKSVDASVIVLKTVHEEILKLLGSPEPLNIRHAPPVIIMMVGLQGAGKTTTCGKLAKYLRDEMKRRPLLVPADVSRPAAITQLQQVGAQLNIPVFPSQGSQTPLEIATQSDIFARNGGFDTIILDTAGRLQINRELMNELVAVVEAIEPHEILLVVDSMTGQQSVEVARGFNDRLDIDGIIMTKFDGDARGGAALSMRAVIQKPIKFIGVGEKSEALEVFHPDRMATRNLGMGDLKGLFEKLQKQISLEEAEKLQKKIKQNDFTLEDFRAQLAMVKNMGSMSSMLQMVPGMGKISQQVDDAQAEKSLKRVEAILLSMTNQERNNPDVLNGNRRKRIAKGSGTTVEEVNALIKQYEQMRMLMKKFKKGGKGFNPGSLLGGMGGSFRGPMNQFRR